MNNNNLYHVLTVTGEKDKSAMSVRNWMVYSRGGEFKHKKVFFKFFF